MKIDSLKIRMLHSDKGMNQAELAEKAGLSRPALNVMLGKGSCYAMSAYKIAKALDVPLEQIIKSE
ncbi:helix-turn-helix domain-containing protein [Proteiniclasticum sp. QWL-01]|uniref:helix-turn-helix transcriptional regulator n=1 Tax=Proteiniclasticum sp. QWL-01 TaxID=3036945 RepID=UPI0024103CC3|nr:helix-turn-helix domain-containing protein [Proteiniclasticum sp. QWL-01]WFF73008.1 helix-turn-helix domain-containing protein [Proteiniclasticum sp. QWL-01]